MKKILILIFVLSAGSFAKGQNTYPAFWNDIQKFHQQDSAKFPQSGHILFIGSSSFTMWTDVNKYFPGYNILNRGFGGSTLEDLITYRYDVIFPYSPRQIVMYCGENDFASSDTISVAIVMQRFKTLFGFIRDKFPKVPFAYVAMKPSPSRAHLMPKFSDANLQIKKYLAGFKDTKYIDVYSKMLKLDATPMTDIFLDDNLHMNPKGYAIWKKAFLPVLIKNNNVKK